MKKIVLLVAAICAFCACNKEGGKGSGSSDPAVTKVEVICEVASIPGDILDNYDIYYDFTDFEGTKHSEQLTGKGNISFYKNNPGLSDVSSNPFTIALRVAPKSGAAQKETYDATYSIKFGINGYYENGELANGSFGKDSTPFLGKYGKGTAVPEDSFREQCDEIAEDATTYEITHCKASSGEWYIGVRSK